jgi:hypothetical protein
MLTIDLKKGHECERETIWGGEEPPGEGRGNVMGENDGSTLDACVKMS